jgi:hypothetical protein
MFLDECYEFGELGGIAGAFGPASLGSATLSIPPLEEFSAWIVRALDALVWHCASMRRADASFLELRQGKGAHRLRVNFLGLPNTELPHDHGRLDSSLE